MLLEKGTNPVCVLRRIHLEGFRLPKTIFIELRKSLPFISYESLAVDIFSGLVTRELINRVNNEKCHCKSCNSDRRRKYTNECSRGHFEASKAFSLICVILLRNTIPLAPKQGQKERFLSWEDRQKVLKVMLGYGVQCADGSCCGLAVDPLVTEAEIGPDKRVQMTFFKNAKS